MCVRDFLGHRCVNTAREGQEGQSVLWVGLSVGRKGINIKRDAPLGGGGGHNVEEVLKKKKE